MRNAAVLFVSSVLLIQPLGPKLFSDASEPDNNPESTTMQPASSAEEQVTPPEPTPKKIVQRVSTAPFKAFTGKITKSKVRVRLQPNLDGPILREFNKDDLVIVLGETDDFYAIQPPKELRAYVFRTYVLDNVVEGSRVNVRLEPDLDAPVVGQLNQGDRIQGAVSALNSKWLEIAMPQNARFYISKDFVENAGDPSMMATFERRRDEVNYLLNTTYANSQTELQKPFDQINMEGIIGNLKKIINNYSEFPEQVTRAKEILAQVQDSYVQKKISYLESQAKSANESLAMQNRGQLSDASTNPNAAAIPVDEPEVDEGQNSKMASWENAEKAFYDSWAEENNNLSQDTFYEIQAKDAVNLTGILEPYNRTVKNKPGDYMLVNPKTSLPVAYLYSTKVNLQRKVGKEVTIQGLARPNNNFAFPAYFALTIE